MAIPTLHEDFAGMAERLRRSTVHVRSGRAGAGSGVIWRPDGLIVTNAHVVRRDPAVVELADGRELEAHVTDADPRRDLASLTVDARDLPAVTVGDSDDLRVGQLVVAVGNPLGLSGALTTGILHAIAPRDESDRQTWVQADVRLAPGNSGGPLADVLGRVIGINSMVAGGLGLAVPSNAVTRFLQGAGARPRIGIVTQPVLVRRDGGQAPGLLILETESCSAADAAGLIVGDIVVGVNGVSFGSHGDLPAAIEQAGESGALGLDILRGGREMAVTVTPLSKPRQEAA
jgi:serine protease Do